MRNSRRKNNPAIATQYQFMMVQGLLSLNRYNAWSATLLPMHRKRAHWILELFGATLAMAGTFVMVNEKTVHFNSLHGKLGKRNFDQGMTWRRMYFSNNEKDSETSIKALAGGKCSTALPNIEVGKRNLHQGVSWRKIWNFSP
ncbi:hypothetical protein EVAR_20497_1 [Eumeta japonica]|uniref:Uncharacterized protein n=1 Tax=Eumeta variegata TaxID=151549 RepID=A0A4C1Y674_EUMVA|nr:hypothetical protein EVAR_20497_1 [Eumeta japonica]